MHQQIFKYLNVPKGQLIITQDGYFLPFEVLSKPSKRAEYLLNDYAISYTYSIQFLLKNLGENSFSFRYNGWVYIGIIGLLSLLGFWWYRKSSTGF